MSRGIGRNEKLKELLRKWMFAIARKIVYKWQRETENEVLSFGIVWDEEKRENIR